MKGPGLKKLLTVTSFSTAGAARKSVDTGKTAVAVVIPTNLSSVLLGQNPGGAPTLSSTRTPPISSAGRSSRASPIRRC